MYSDVSFSNSFPRLIKYVENFKNKLLHKPEDALQETEEMGDTGETVDNGGKGDTELTGSEVLRHYLTEIKPKMGEFSKSFEQVLKIGLAELILSWYWAGRADGAESFKRWNYLY